MNGASLVTAAEASGRLDSSGKEYFDELLCVASLWDCYRLDACGLKFFRGSPAHAAAQDNRAVAQSLDNAGMAMGLVMMVLRSVLALAVSVGGVRVVPDLLARDLPVLDGKDHETATSAEVWRDVRSIRGRNRNLHVSLLSFRSEQA